MTDDELPQPLAIAPPPDPEAQPGAAVSLYPGQGGGPAVSARPSAFPRAGAETTARRQQSTGDVAPFGATLLSAAGAASLAAPAPAPAEPVGAAPSPPVGSRRPAPPGDGLPLRSAPPRSLRAPQADSGPSPSLRAGYRAGVGPASRRPASAVPGQRTSAGVVSRGQSLRAAAAPAFAQRAASAHPARANRRRGPDAYVQLPWAFSVVGFLMMLAAISLSERATTNNHGVNSFFGITRARFYEPQWYHMAGGITLFTFVLSVLGLYMNSKRMRRKGDRYSRSLILLLCMSLAGSVRYVLFMLGGP